MRFPEAEETERLRVKSQESRLCLIETELNLVTTWCSVAKTEGELGEADKFRDLLGKVRQATAILRQHINDPAHVPIELAPQFREKLEHLERKVRALERSQRP